MQHKKVNKFGCIVIRDASMFQYNTKLRGVTLVCDSVSKSLLKHLHVKWRYWQVTGGDLRLDLYKRLALWRPGHQ
jgi:hypothetical protein